MRWDETLKSWQRTGITTYDVVQSMFTNAPDATLTYDTRILGGSSGLYLNSIQELFRLVLAVGLLVCPTLAFDVLRAHTLREGHYTGGERETHQPLSIILSSHIPSHISLFSFSFEGFKTVLYIASQRGGDKDMIYFQMTGYSQNRPSLEYRNEKLNRWSNEMSHLLFKSASSYLLSSSFSSGMSIQLWPTHT